MSHKVYRICLLSVVIFAIVGGIFYYLNYVQKESDITEGTLVRQEAQMQEAKMQAAVQDRMRIWGSESACCDRKEGEQL